MSVSGPDMRLDALLTDLPAPPVPAGLTERVVVAAMAAKQEPRAARARRAAGPRHDRRGRWLRRPLLIGIGAFGIALSGAVAATLAGVPIPAKIAAVFSQAFAGEEKAEPRASPPRRARPPRPAPAPAAAQAIPSEPPAAAVPVRTLGAQRRLAIARRIVAERRAAGLPTPIADRFERRLRIWRGATPEQRAALRDARRERLRQRIEARRAIRGERVPAAIRPRQTEIAPATPVPIRRAPTAAALPPARPVYGPVDDRAESLRRRSENAARRPWLRDPNRIGEPVAGRRGVIRQRAPAPVNRRPAPARPRRR